MRGLLAGKDSSSGSHSDSSSFEEYEGWEKAAKAVKI
jgi:hypothetical protein